MSEDNVAIKFHRGSPPYEPGDIAGFSKALAQRYVDKGVAEFHDLGAGPSEGDVDPLAELDRAALIAFAKDKLGLTDEPPASTSDDQLRDAVRAALADKAKKSSKAK